MNREDLIEEAAKAMCDRAGEEEWEDCPQDWYRADARAAFAVFEQAHSKNLRVAASTPTDDGRFVKSFGGWTPDEVARNPRAAAEVIERLRSRVIDGFRRPMQAEPQEVDADPDTAFELGRVAGYDEAMREVQAEPTDAQLADIESRVYDAHRGQVAGMAKEMVRAGWRAAFQEGENR